MMISIVLPAYLEAENLKNILPKLRGAMDKLGEEYEILIIDTMTPMDCTEDVCKQNGVEYVPRTGGNLYGDAMRTGFSRAKGKYIVVMDADGSHDPNDIIKFYREMQQDDYDIVIGSRYCKGGYTDNNFILKLMSWSLNIMYRLLFKLEVKDVSDSFRMYNADKLRQLTLECDNFDIVEEILIKLKYTYSNFKVKEVPIAFNKREAGDSKRDLVKFIFSYITTIKRLMKIKNSVRRKSGA